MYPQSPAKPGLSGGELGRLSVDPVTNTRQAQGRWKVPWSVPRPPRRGPEPGCKLQWRIIVNAAFLLLSSAWFAGADAAPAAAPAAVAAPAACTSGCCDTPCCCEGCPKKKHCHKDKCCDCCVVECCQPTCCNTCCDCCEKKHCCK